MLAKLGRVRIKVLKIILNDFAAFTSLIILPIRKVLIIVVIGPTFKWDKKLIKSPKTAPSTIVKSKMFQPS